MANSFYFSEKEQSCPCCGSNNCDQAFLFKMNAARNYAEIPFVINSWCRCCKHNADVGGSPTSSHLKGVAVDLWCNSSEARYKILDGLLYAGFTRIGIGKTFIHVDSDKDKSQGVIWIY